MTKTRGEIWRRNKDELIDDVSLMIHAGSLGSFYLVHLALSRKTLQDSGRANSAKVSRDHVYWNSPVFFSLEHLGFEPAEQCYLDGVNTVCWVPTWGRDTDCST